jgi:hypothetical protein
MRRAGFDPLGWLIVATAHLMFAIVLFCIAEQAWQAINGRI